MADRDGIQIHLLIEALDNCAFGTETEKKEKIGTSEMEGKHDEEGKWGHKGDRNA